MPISLTLQQCEQSPQYITFFITSLFKHLFRYFFLRAWVYWPLLCLCRPFCIFERCLEIYFACSVNGVSYRKLIPESGQQLALESLVFLASELILWITTFLIYQNRIYGVRLVPDLELEMLFLNLYRHQLKGKASRDGFGFWWHAWSVLGLKRGIGQF